MTSDWSLLHHLRSLWSLLLLLRFLGLDFVLGDLNLVEVSQCACFEMGRREERTTSVGSTVLDSSQSGMLNGVRHRRCSQGVSKMVGNSYRRQGFCHDNRHFSFEVSERVFAACRFFV